MKKNAWKNYETWNVALWIWKDQGINSIAQECDCYHSFQEAISEIELKETPDGVSFSDKKLDLNRLSELIHST